MTDHLWESTLFAAATALLTLILRNNPARVRHWLWLAASVKFLIPFSLLVGIGNHFGWRTEAPAQLSYLAEGFNRTLSAPEIQVTPRAASPISWQTIGEAVWIGGGAVVLFLWGVRWRRVRRAVRSASPLRMDIGIEVMSTPLLLEPGVFGILRPVLLLPEGIAERLTVEQLDAIVAHELCHVRRRDNLTAAIHMVVEALFWFHPMVWWIGARMVEEREKACDEEVLRIGKEPEVYAEGILKVCRFYVESPVECVSGVTGSNLKKRIEKIMTRNRIRELGFVRKVFLGVAGFAAIAAPIGFGVLSAQERPRPVAQPIATSALPEFEAASIKPSAPDSNLRVDFAPGGKLFITNATLRFLIKIAYDVGDDQLAGGPGWIGSKRFDLAATPEKPLGGDPKNMAPDQILLFHEPVRLRLQRLLTDRFQLELRKESTPMPIFALVVAKGGSKKLTVTRSTADPQMNGKLGNGVLSAVGADMATLAKFLSEGQTGRPVVDMTGLKDKYDFHLEWVPDTSQNSPPADAAGVSIFTALQQQLGLKLEARTGAADRLVVVRAELPSAN
jgi:uncharacterized protein (TIGR03435 family)